MGKMYGYARVSSQEQHEDRQVLALKHFGVAEGDIFIDKQSGKDFERPQYKKLLKCLASDDVIVIKSIDRLGRNYIEIIEEWRIITKEIGADAVILDMSLLDTRQKQDLTGIFIADLVLQILSYVAEQERRLIHERQAEGIAAAKKRGVKFGRPAIECPGDFLEVYDLWKRKELNCRDAGKLLSVSHYTFLKWAGKYEQTAE